MFRKRYFKRRGKRGGSIGIYTMVKKISAVGNITYAPPTELDVARAWIFRASDDADAANQMGFWELFRIRKVYFEIEPIMPVPVAEIAEESGNYLTWPKAAIVFDPDDASVPSISLRPEYYKQLIKRRYYSLADFRTGKKAKLTFVPRVASSVYNSVSSTAYTPIKSPWLNTNTPDTPHYSVKLGMETWGASTLFWGTRTMHYRVSYTMWIDFKRPKALSDNT